jgi:hypothetical protein
MPYIVFGRNTCLFCDRAKRLLKEHRRRFRFIHQSHLQTAQEFKTVPQIWRVPRSCNLDDVHSAVFEGKQLMFADGRPVPKVQYIGGFQELDRVVQTNKHKLAPNLPLIGGRLTPSELKRKARAVRQIYTSGKQQQQKPMFGEWRPKQLQKIKDTFARHSGYTLFIVQNDKARLQKIMKHAFEKLCVTQRTGYWPSETGYFDLSSWNHFKNIYLDMNEKFVVFAARDETNGQVRGIALLGFSGRQVFRERILKKWRLSTKMKRVLKHMPNGGYIDVHLLCGTRVGAVLLAAAKAYADNVAGVSAITMEATAQERTDFNRLIAYYSRFTSGPFDLGFVGLQSKDGIRGKFISLTQR